MRAILALSAAAVLSAGAAAHAQQTSPNDTARETVNRATGQQQPQTGGLTPTSPKTNLPDWTSQQGNHADDATSPRTGPAPPGAQAVISNRGQNTNDTQARTGQGAPASARAGDVPSSWRGDAASWDAHAAACAARYRTYDRATDLFYARPGVQARCMLSMPNAR